MADRITFKCVDCGQPVVIDETNPPNDNDIIKCTGCGRTFGPYSEVKEAAIKLGKQALDKMIDDAGLPDWIIRK